jgi:hypothetical protein
MTVHVPQIVRVAPPAALMQATPRPVFNGTTNGDLLDYAGHLERSVDACNADKASLRDWARGGER